MLRACSAGHSWGQRGSHCTLVKSRVKWGGTCNMKGVSLALVFFSPNIDNLQMIWSYRGGLFCNLIIIFYASQITFNPKQKHIHNFTLKNVMLHFTSPLNLPDWRLSSQQGVYRMLFMPRDSKKGFSHPTLTPNHILFKHLTKQKMKSASQIKLNQWTR